MQDHEGELDITSEPEPLSSDQGNPFVKPPKFTTSSPKTMKVVFGCCRVYSMLRIPENVLNGELKVWRVHCARCGRLVEIPNEDPS